MVAYLAALAVASTTGHRPAAGIALIGIFAAVLAGLVIAARRRDDTVVHEGAHADWSPVAELSDVLDSGPVVTIDELLETPVFAATATWMRVRVEWEPPPFQWAELGEMQVPPEVEAISA